MGFLFDLYSQCLDSFELLEIVPKLPEAKNEPGLVEIARLKQLPGVTLENHQALKKIHLRRSDKALKKWLTQGTYISMGYRSIDDKEPSIIPSHEWCSLAIDYMNSRAFCTGREYTGVRFMNALMLERLSDDQIKFIERAAKGEQPAKAFEGIDSGDDVTSQKLDVEELSIGSIMHYWFRYELKEETPAARYKYYDEKKRISALLRDAVENGRVKTRIEIKEIKQDVYPNEFTRYEHERYLGRAYTKVSTVKTVYVQLDDLAQFLWLNKEVPPKDSPLMTKWLAKWWPDDEPQAKAAAVNTGKKKTSLKNNDQRNEIAKKWMAEENRDLDAMTNKEILEALDTFAGH